MPQGKLRRLLLPIVAVLLGWAAGRGSGQAPLLAAAEKPRQYKVVDVEAGSPFERILNEQARDGWSYRGDISERGTPEALVFER